MEGLSGEHASRLGPRDICLHGMCRGCLVGRVGTRGHARVAGTGVCRVREQTREKGVG